MNFGERLRSLRSEKEYSLRKMAEELEISFSALGKYERNEHQPDFDTLKKIANYFNVSIDWLLGRTILRTHTLEQEKDLAKRIQQLNRDIDTSEDLTFNSEPLSEESKKALSEALEFAVRLGETISKKHPPGE